LLYEHDGCSTRLIVERRGDMTPHVLPEAPMDITDARPTTAMASAATGIASVRARATYSPQRA
jgi:hypothetical protein